MSTQPRGSTARRELDTQIHGSRVVFGRPWAEVITDVVSGSRVGIVCSARRRDLAQTVAESLPDARSIVIARARRHVPSELVAETAAALDAHRADAVVTAGGGSAIGLGKAVQLECTRELVVLPTTYSGSEMTNIFGIREGGRKRVGRDDRVRPDAVVYDPELTLDLPLPVSLPSLFNAMAHAVDALYVEPSEQTMKRAAESIRSLAAAIADLAEAPRERDARTRAMWGAHLAAAILNDATLAIHHKLAHIVGGSFDLPHAQTHTVLLPHVIGFNAAHAPEATRIIADALDARDPAGAVFDLARRAGAPTDLASLGFGESDVTTAAQQLVTARFENPRKPNIDEAIALLSAARSGARPVSEITT